MRIRAEIQATEEDKNHIIFKSIVFAQINEGIYEEYLVLFPEKDHGRLGFIPEFSRVADKLKKNTMTISPDIPDEWISKKNLKMTILRRDGSALEVSSFRGYPWMLDHPDFLSLVSTDEESAMNLLKRLQPDAIHHGNTPDGKWTYADTQEELLQLVNIFGGFHDACIKEMKYLSGSYVASNLSMNPIDDIRQVRIVFQRQWENPSCIEVIFEGVQQLNLVPGRDGYSSDIFQAYLMARDGFVYFCDYTDEIDRLVKNAYFCTWIKALSLRWRIADEYLGNELIYNNTK